MSGKKRLLIHNKATNETRECNPFWADRIDWKHGEFEWSEGNAACDCQRGEWFAEAYAEPDPMANCDGENYFVRITNDQNIVLYQDGEWPKEWSEQPILQPMRINFNYKENRDGWTELS